MGHNITVHRRWLAVLGIAAAVASRPAAVAQETVVADQFVDTVGVNIHLHYDKTFYWDQFPQVKSRLNELGVRHVRDGLVDSKWMPYYERHKMLAQAGIKGVFITAPGQSLELWTGYPARMGEAFEAFEAPNEYDLKSKDPKWSETLKETVKSLHAVKDDPRAAKFPIYGPSLTSAKAFDMLGDVSAFYDFANLHNYFAGRDPGSRGWGANGYGSIAWNLGLTGRFAAGKPVVTTETGYQDDPAVKEYAPPEVAGRYMPRLLLEQFRAGIVRTYLYELADFPKSGSYGLLRADGSPKPAFRAVKGLLNLLSDPGPPVTLRTLDYTVRGGTGDLRHMAFQKRDGTYLVALWLSLPSYSPATRQPIAVPAQNVEVTLPAEMRPVRTHRWQADGSVSVTPAQASGGTVPVSVTDSLMMIELTSGKSSSRSTGR
jgi:hypothetical protein